MERDEIRLQCLKLVHRFDRHPSEVVVDAKIYEDYISSEPQVGPPKSPGRPRKTPADAEKPDTL